MPIGTVRILPGGDAANGRDFRGYLDARQNAALAGLGALRQLDLEHLHLRDCRELMQCVLIEASVLTADAIFGGAEQRFKVQSDNAIPEGDHIFSFEFKPTGKADIAKGKGVPAEVTLLVDGAPVGKGDLPVTIPLSLGLSAGVCVGSNGVYQNPQGGGVAWCQAHFRSYNPATGTYLGNDGRHHPCP